MRISQTGEVTARMKVFNGTTWVELQTVSSGAPDLGLAASRPFDVEPYDDSAYSFSTLQTSGAGTTVKVALHLPGVSAVDLIVERIVFVAPNADFCIIQLGATLEGGDVGIGPAALGHQRRTGSITVPIGIIDTNPASLLGPPAVREIARAGPQTATPVIQVFDVPHQIDVLLDGIAVIAGRAAAVQDLGVAFYWREEL
jgi:hypothetical protein